MSFTITWESLVLFAAGIITLLGAWRAIITLKRDILKNVEDFVCASVDKKIGPFVANQADVLRYSITRAHAEYSRRGAVDKYSLQALEYLYRDYHALNGNGFVDGLMEELRDLPTQTKWEKFEEGKRNE